MFDLDTLEVDDIREHQDYGGLRVSMNVMLDRASMKDYYDLWLIADTFGFEGNVLMRAFMATFERRGTDLPPDDPIGLTREFAEAPDNVKRWLAFLDANGLDDAPKELQRVIDAMRDFVLPPLRAASGRHSFEQRWSAGEGWS